MLIFAALTTLTVQPMEEPEPVPIYTIRLFPKLKEIPAKLKVPDAEVVPAVNVPPLTDNPITVLFSVNVPSARLVNTVPPMV